MPVEKLESPLVPFNLIRHFPAQTVTVEPSIGLFLGFVVTPADALRIGVNEANEGRLNMPLLAVSVEAILAEESNWANNAAFVRFELNRAVVYSPQSLQIELGTLVTYFCQLCKRHAEKYPKQTVPEMFLTENDPWVTSPELT